MGTLELVRCIGGRWGQVRFMGDAWGTWEQVRCIGGTWDT